MSNYILNMRLVDKWMAYMQISNVECVRKSMQWYKKLFLHILDITVLNAYKRYLVTTGNMMPLKDFH